MKTNLQRLAKERWQNSQSFLGAWEARNEKLLNLLERSGVTTTGFSFSEYGCGPNKPFSTLIKKKTNLEIIALDLKKWDDHTIKIDLDSAPENAPETTIGVLSGVVEYLKSPSETLEYLSHKHQYILLSYRIFQFDPAGSIETHSERLSDRARKGWRNHLSIEDFLRTMNTYGYIVNSDVWQKQSLFLLKNWNSES